MKNKNQKGITLVALVITIIVLLILAGVAINMAINSDGLFRKANEAVDQYGEARKNESTAISDLFDTLTEIETGIKIEQVTDAKPGELEGSGTEADPYTINSIEDLVFFSQDVRNGNTYAEEYVKLGLSLDFNSNKSYVDPYRTDYEEYGYNGELKTLLTTGEGFKPIGQNDFTNGDDTTKCFAGTFDGNAKKILNLYINIAREEQTTKVGFFSMNSGIIKNIGLENVNIQVKKNVMLVGVLSGQNRVTGSIEKCYVKGKIFAGTKNIGGITGFATGTIKDCYSTVDIINNIKEEIEGEETVIIGGILPNGSGLVSNCYYTGKIEHTSNTYDVQIGGIEGTTTRTRNNCYNAGEILIKSNNAIRLYVGGISGCLSGGTLENCHSKGKITTTSNNIQIPSVGGVVGYQFNATLNNCYSLSSAIEKGIGNGTDTTTAVEKESDMPSILSVVGEAFKEDTNNINNGYPILDWQ